RVYLPRHEELAAEEAPTAVAAPTVVPRGRETILVAEDEEGVRDLVQRVLRGEGYDVLTARDGAEALALCGRHGGTIDLLVTDLIMPSLGGTELVARLAPRRPGMRVLYLSGYSEDVLEEQGAPG